LRGGLYVLYRKRRNSDFIQLKFGIIMYFVLMVAVIFIINNFRNYMKEYNPSNLFYIQLLNYSLPVVKTTSFEEEALSESEGTLSQQMIKIIGLDIFNPLKIIGKEIAFLKGLDFEKKEVDLPKVAVSIDPFSFDESKVIKVTENQTSDTGNSENTPVNVNNPSPNENLNNLKPEVLIYHTHTTESFSPNGNYNGDFSKNITSVGTIVTNELKNKYGISVIHDTTIHNSSMVKAYQRSSETLNKYLNQYRSFKLIIDMHRDGGPEKSSTTIKINNENTAKIMFVLSKQSQYFKENQETTNNLMNISDKIFPGLNRDKVVYKEKGYYNQNKSPNTVLIEVGCEKNTLQEAQNSGRYIARIISEYLKGKQ
jgi:stage II sporulation protein P